MRDVEARALPVACLSPLVAALHSDVTYVDATHERQPDHDANDAWMAERLGVEPVARAWRVEERGPWR
jgi:hypothetical protein